MPAVAFQVRNPTVCLTDWPMEAFSNMKEAVLRLQLALASTVVLLACFLKVALMLPTKVWSCLENDDSNNEEVDGAAGQARHTVVELYSPLMQSPFMIGILQQWSGKKKKKKRQRYKPKGDLPSLTGI